MKKILLIDDEEEFCSSIKGFLESSGEFQVTTCIDGTKALDLVLQHKPDLVLLDVMMPKIGGMKIAQKLSAVPQTRQTPIVFITALPLEQEGQEFVIKPVDVISLKGKLVEVLNRPRAG